MINLFVKLRVQIFAEVVDHICVLLCLVAKKMEERERIETLFTIYTAKKKALINVLDWKSDSNPITNNGDSF